MGYSTQQSSGKGASQPSSVFAPSSGGKGSSQGTDAFRQTGNIGRTSTGPGYRGYGGYQVRPGAYNYYSGGKGNPSTVLQQLLQPLKPKVPETTVAPTPETTPPVTQATPTPTPDVPNPPVVETPPSVRTDPIVSDIPDEPVVPDTIQAPPLELPEIPEEKEKKDTSYWDDSPDPSIYTKPIVSDIPETVVPDTLDFPAPELPEVRPELDDGSYWSTDVDTPEVGPTRGQKELGPEFDQYLATPTVEESPQELPGSFDKYRVDSTPAPEVTTLPEPSDNNWLQPGEYSTSGYPGGIPGYEGYEQYGGGGGGGAIFDDVDWGNQAYAEGGVVDPLTKYVKSGGGNSAQKTKRDARRQRLVDSLKGI